MKIILILNIFIATLFANSYYYEFGEKVELKKLNEKRSVNNSDVNYYIKPNGKKIGITNDILVKCIDENNCLNVLNEYEFKNLSKLSKTLFRISLTNNDNIFEICEKLSSNPEIKFAVPNVIKEIKKR